MLASPWMALTLQLPCIQAENSNRKFLTRFFLSGQLKWYFLTPRMVNLMFSNGDNELKILNNFQVCIILSFVNCLLDNFLWSATSYMFICQSSHRITLKKDHHYFYRPSWPNLKLDGHKLARVLSGIVISTKQCQSHPSQLIRSVYF